MRGGAIEYSPLPCDANGNTNWDSTLQVGHETCVEYGTHGAENDSRASGLGADLSEKNITETIQDVVDQQLKDIMGNLDGQSAAAVRQAMQAKQLHWEDQPEIQQLFKEQWILKLLDKHIKSQWKDKQHKLRQMLLQQPV